MLGHRREVGQRQAAAAALTMMLRALVLAVALAPAARADCEVCKKKHVKEIKSCGAFWTPSKYVGEFAKREAPAPTPRPTPPPTPNPHPTHVQILPLVAGITRGMVILAILMTIMVMTAHIMTVIRMIAAGTTTIISKRARSVARAAARTSWRRLGRRRTRRRTGAFSPTTTTNDDDDEDDDWTDSRSRCHKDVCCAAHESDCCEADVGAIAAFTFALLALVICCIVACSCAACKDCPAGQKSNRRYVVLGFLAFLCAGMQCIAMLRGPLWARTVYHIEITDDEYEENDGYSSGDREWTGECVSDTSTTDSNGNSCSYYDEGNNYYCGNYDDSNFDANEMCCACGGGNRDNQWKSGWTEENDLWLWVYKDNSHTEKHVIKEDKVKNCAWTRRGLGRRRRLPVTRRRLERGRRPVLQARVAGGDHRAVHHGHRVPADGPVRALDAPRRVRVPLPVLLPGVPRRRDAADLHDPRRGPRGRRLDCYRGRREL